VQAYGEAWALVDAMPSVCRPGLPSAWGAPWSNELPNFLHACQHYSAAKRFAFGKRSVDHGIFKCPAPTAPSEALGATPTAALLPSGKPARSLDEPPEDVLSAEMQAAVARSIAEAREQKRKLTKQEKAARDAKRGAFMTCTATKVLNLAIQAHRRDYCGTRGASGLV